MTSSKKIHRRRIIFTSAAIILLGTAVLLYQTRGIDLGTVLALVGGVSSILGLVSSTFSALAKPDVLTTPDRLDKALKSLAGQVQQYWREEVDLRHLRDPEPLVVRWRLTERVSVMDHPINVGNREEIRFIGRTDQVEQIVQQLRGLPRKRLVILGEPGIGKTTLAVLMTNELLSNFPSSFDLIPVFFSVSDWDAEHESLDDWLARRISANYPSLGAAEFGSTAIRELAKSRLILPILDGLDELSVSLRVRALHALSTAAERPMVITCRTLEYASAVKARNNQPLRAAAVIESVPLEAGDVEEYLRRCLHHQEGSWPRLLSELAAGPVGRALSTPLYLWLLRKVFIENGRDPARLLRLRSSQGIKNCLIDGLVGSLIDSDRERRRQRKAGNGVGQVSHAIHEWPEESVRRWLGFLANFVRRSESGNLRWWDMHKASPVAMKGVRVCAGLLAGAILGTIFGWQYVLLFASLGGVAFFMSRPGRAEPRYANLRLTGRLRRIPSRLIESFRFTSLIGLGAFTVFYFFIDTRAAILSGIGYALSGGLLFTLSDTIATPSATDDRASTPTSTVRRDRTMTIVHILAVGLTNAAGLGLAIGWRNGTLVAIAFGLAGSIGTELEVRLFRRAQFRYPFGFSGVGSAWANYLVVRCILFICRRTPLRLTAFVDDCYGLGLLRREGPYYQFRHLDVQARLASVYARKMRQRQRSRSSTASSS